MNKKFFLSIVILICLMMILPQYTFAANEKLGASISGSGSGDTDAADGTLSMTVTGSSVNGTLTITNNEAKAATLSFSYTADGDINSFKIGGNSVSKSGSYNTELAAGSSIAIYLSVTRKSIFSGNRSATVSLTAVKLQVPQDANVTITYNGAGSVSSGDTAITSGDTISVPATGTTFKATPKSGATFVAWIDPSDNSVVSTDATITYKPAGDSTLKAIFASPTTEASFWGSDKAYLFEGLSGAITHATNTSNKVITLAGNGILSAGNYYIPSGVTLVIPFDSAGTYYTDTPGCDQSNWSKPSAFYTLTMQNGANIVVNGAISVSAKVSGKMGYSGNPTSKYGHVAMSEGSSIDVNSGGNLYAWGYITGAGTVTIKSGATVYESFQVVDWRGGTYTTKMLDNSQKVFPMAQYYIQNVEAPMVLESGATEKCSLAAVISSVLQQKTVPFIGKSGHMFNITSGSITKQYDGITDRLILDVNGDFNIGSISIVMVEGFIGIGRVEIKSANYVLPVNGNITLDINSGSTMTIGSSVSFLPGVQVNIAEGGTLKIGSGKQLFVYDDTEWKAGKFLYNAAYFRPIAYAPSKTYTRTLDNDIVDVQIVVNGTLDASEGYLYTTASGGNICSTGNGVVKLKDAETSPTLYETTQTSDTPTYASIPITAAQLKNGDGRYVQTSAVTYIYCSDCMKWLCDDDDDSHGHAVKHATNVELGNGLNMYFAFWSDSITITDGHYVVVSHTDWKTNETNTKKFTSDLWKTVDVKISDTVIWQNAYYVYYDELSSKQMGDVITVTLYTSSGDVVDTWSNSIQHYAMRMLSKHSDNQTLRTLIVDMLNYGAACQTAFGYNADNLVNAGLSAEQKSWATKDVTWSSSLPSGNSSYEANLVADGSIRFAISGANDQSTYSFMNHWGVTRDDQEFKSAGDYYYISKLYVADARQVITITMGEITWTDSVEAYCKRMVDGKKDTNGVFTAFMKFSNSAHEYLHDEGARV